MEEINHMDNKKGSSSCQKDCEVRKGPWTMEEDLILINYISTHGEGVWNNLARSAGLKRTGKSCRLRWLNYLRPDIRRGNITPEEQLLIMDLQARWGNRWSKIARQMPGRTDNEIKNYWRTRIQKKVKNSENSSSSNNNNYSDYIGNFQTNTVDDGYLQKSAVNNPVGDEGSTSQTGSIDEGMIPCSPMFVESSTINGQDGFVPNPSSSSTCDHCSADGLWGVDDLWSSMHLFNND